MKTIPLDLYKAPTRKSLYTISKHSMSPLFLLILSSCVHDHGIPAEPLAGADVARSLLGLEEDIAPLDEIQIALEDEWKKVQKRWRTNNARIEGYLWVVDRLIDTAAMSTAAQMTKKFSLKNQIEAGQYLIKRLVKIRSKAEITNYKEYKKFIKKAKELDCFHTRLQQEIEGLTGLSQHPSNTILQIKKRIKALHKHTRNANDPFRMLCRKISVLRPQLSGWINKSHQDQLDPFQSSKPFHPRGHYATSYRLGMFYKEIEAVTIPHIQERCEQCQQASEEMKVFQNRLQHTIYQYETTIKQLFVPMVIGQDMSPTYKLLKEYIQYANNLCIEMRPKKSLLQHCICQFPEEWQDIRIQHPASLAKSSSGPSQVHTWHAASPILGEK